MVFLFFLIFSVYSEYKDVPFGLQQCGNACYMNSVIQNLYNLYDLTELFKKTEDQFQRGSFTKAYIELIKTFELLEVPVIPATIINDFYRNYVQTMFAEQAAVQQDAHDFLGAAINLFLINAHNQNTKATIQKLLFYKLNTRLSPFSNPTFFQDTPGQFQSILSIAHPKPPLIIDEQEPLTVQAILQRELSPQEVEYKFDVSRGPEKTWRTESFLNVPEYFIIHLKIFTPDGKVQYPFHVDEFLEIAVRNHSSKQKYELIGAILHSGSEGGGHYKTLIKRKTNIWYECDDARITPYHDQATLLDDYPFLRPVEDLHKIIFQLEHAYIPYILFYKKIDQPHKPEADHFEQYFKKMADNAALLSSLF